MRANVIMFWILAVFFGLSAIVYGFWSYIDDQDPGMEWAGTVALALTTVLTLCQRSLEKRYAKGAHAHKPRRTYRRKRATA